MTLLPALLALQAALPARPHLEAVRVSEPPKIDGRLDDAAWKETKGTTSFTQKFPDEGKLASEPTTLKIVYDDDAVYVAFDCVQTHVPIVERLTRRDRYVESDWVTIDLDTRGDGTSAFEFSVNPAGVLLDAVRYNDTDYSSDWDENWTARTRVDARGWTVEMKIPLRVLRFASLPVQSWGLEARRYVELRQETDEWAFIPRAAAGEVSHYGKLDDLRGLRSKSPLELRPFVVGQVNRRDPGSDVVASGTELRASAGLDLVWHPTQDLTLDGTINPDFAQVEADQLILNLTTFETYYPEKRPFFLEGIDTFATPIQVLYTRRIGRAPERPTLRTDPPYSEQLYDVPSPATIYGASKLVGRVSEHWTVGTLSALTAENDVRIQRADGSREARLADPMAAYNVARIKHDLGGNGHLGAIFTSTTRVEPTGSYPRAPDGSGTFLCPSGTQVATGRRCFHDAYVTGVDGRWRSKDGNYMALGQVIASVIRDGPSRSMPDGTVIAAGDVGPAAYLEVAKQGGGRWVWDVQYDFAAKKVDYNDLGFMRTQNLHHAAASIEYRTLEPIGATLETHTRVETYARQNLDGQDQGRGLQLNDYARWSNFMTTFVELHFRPAHFDDREVGDGTALERAGLLGLELGFGSDPRKAFSFGVFSVEQLLFDGYNFEGGADFTVRPLPQLDFTLSPSWVWTDGEPRYVSAGSLAGEYEFGRLRAKNAGAVLRATYTFTPRLTLQTYAQLFLAAGHYHDFSVYPADPTGPRPAVRLTDLLYGAAPPPTNPDFEQPALNVNVVLRWEYMLGSTIFVVYTRSQSPAVTLGTGEIATLSTASLQRAPAVEALLFKMSFFTPL